MKFSQAVENFNKPWLYIFWNFSNEITFRKTAQYRLKHTLTKGFIDRQEGFHNKHGSSHDLGFLKHVTSFPVQHTIDPAYHLLRALHGKEAQQSDMQ